MRPRHLALLLVVTLAPLVGCTKDRATGPGSTVAGLVSSFDLLPAAQAAGGGSVKGTVKLTGKAPEMTEVNMKSDPFCAKQPGAKNEEIVAGAGGVLKNAVVRITKGMTGAFPPPATPAVMDQNGCMYRPRVQVAQAGQDVTIKNSDQTLHNVHTYKGPATLFNMAQAQGFPAMKKKFPTAGDVIKFKCDVHPWMTGYVVVTDNPFWAITGEDGSFTLKNVPPGSYTVTAWHERLGTTDMQVTVAADKTAEAKFELAAPK